MKGRMAIALVAVLSADAGLATTGNPLRAVGQILNISEGPAGDVVIRHGRQRRPAQRNEYVYSGECVLVRSDEGWAELYVTAGRSRMTIRSTDGCRFPERSPPPGRSAAEWFQDRFSYLFRRSAPPLSSSTGARMRLGGFMSNFMGSTRGSDLRYGSYESPRRSPRRVLAGRPLIGAETLSAERQSIVRSIPFISLQWSGTAEEVQLYTNGRALRRQAIPADASRARIGIDESATEVRLFGRGRPLCWLLAFADEADLPRPPFLPRRARDVTDTDRIAWMAWLIEEGPASWRLYALSELDRLGDRYLPARILADATQTGTWPQPPPRGDRPRGDSRCATGLDEG